MTESLFIRGREYNPTDSQWEEYSRLNDQWKEECDAVFARCIPHVPGALDGNFVNVEINAITEKYLDKIESVLRE